MEVSNSKSHGVSGFEDEQALVSQLQKKIKEDVNTQVNELLGNKEEEKKFLDNLDLLQKKRRMAGFEMSDTNFIERNIECSNDL